MRVDRKKKAELLAAYVEGYYKDIVKTSKINGNVFSYYKALRGYFRHANILTDIKQEEFTVNDYKVWERILTSIKSSHNPVESGGLYFRYDDYKDICSRRAFYNTRRKLLELKLLIKTPFMHYYILNPAYVIKLYNPSSKPY